jgi:hypothetical protein
MTDGTDHIITLGFFVFVGVVLGVVLAWLLVPEREHGKDSAASAVKPPEVEPLQRIEPQPSARPSPSLRAGNEGGGLLEGLLFLGLCGAVLGAVMEGRRQQAKPSEPGDPKDS